MIARMQRGIGDQTTSSPQRLPLMNSFQPIIAAPNRTASATTNSSQAPLPVGEFACASRLSKKTSAARGRR
jgi:hypothetical protein